MHLLMNNCYQDYGVRNAAISCTCCSNRSSETTERHPGARSDAIPTSSSGQLAGFSETSCDLVESYVEVLGGAAQDVEGVTGGDGLAFHEDAFELGR